MSDVTGVIDLMYHYRSTTDRHRYSESITRCIVVLQINFTK